MVNVHIYGSGMRVHRKWGTWVAQPIKHMTLDFDSGHSLRVMRLNPTMGSTLSKESIWDSLPLCLSLPGSLALLLSDKWIFQKILPYEF